MKKFCLIYVFSCFLLTLSGQDTEKKYEGYVNLTADPEFGVYPTIQIGRNITNYNVFVYGIFYYQGREVVRFSSPFKLWVETGVGISKKLAEKNSIISVSIGIMDGKYYSGFKQYGFGDAIAPGFMFVYDKFHYINLGGYYLFSISKHGPTPFDLIWYWGNYAYSIKKNFYLGFYYEHYYQIGDGLLTARYSNIYQWLGPSIEYRLDKASIKLTAGYDRVNDYYYKLSLAYSF